MNSPKYFGYIAICLVGGSFLACSHQPTRLADDSVGVKSRAPSSVELIKHYDIGALPPEQGEIWDPIADTAKSKKLGDLLSSYITSRDQGKDATNRTFHAKHHGCVKAKFEVLVSDLPGAGSLPKDLRIGLFSKPGTYDSWIRFSNGDPEGETAADIKSDIRGMAVKLMNIDGTPTGSQDFVMCTGKEFFAKGVLDYVSLNDAIAGNIWQKLGFIVDLGFDDTLKEDRDHVTKATVQTSSPLETKYYSAVPYKLGNNEEMKFFALPCLENGTHPLPDAKTAPRDYLKTVLEETVGAQKTCFNFFVQVRNHNPGAIIEDSRQPWDETKSPVYLAATINILQDDNIHLADENVDRDNLCENLSFDPWHTRPEMRPLGEMGRMRGLLYQRMSTLRHKQNGTLGEGTPEEPRSLDRPCGDADNKELCNRPNRAPASPN